MLGSIGIRRRRVRIAHWVGLSSMLAVPVSARADALSDLRNAAPGMVTRSAAARGGLRFVHTRNGIRGVSGPADASRFLERHGVAFGLAGDVEARPGDLSRDALGHTRVDFDAYYRGVPVYGAGWSLHFDAADQLVAVRAASVPSVHASEVPGYDAAEAEVLAVALVPGAESSSAAGLFVFDRGLVTGQLPDPRLAYRVVVEGVEQRHEVFIDAHDGALLLAASLIHGELDRRVYDSDYAPGDLIWQESDGPYMGGDSAALDFIAYTEDTYLLYENVSGGSYLSYDGASAPMEGVVHYDTDCPNASWNGTTTNYCNGLVTDDVVAHEWAHAYTQANHRLIYAYQPGALNESYSDIFGEAVDLLNESGDGPHTTRTDGSCAFGGSASERWLIGEETSGLGGAIRDMWVPTCFNHPGRVSDGEYVCTGDDFFDNGGVHFNSGVPNHAFALLVDGGTTGGQSVEAIGMTKALAIYWRAMTVYQGVTSGFADHADALLASCEDLVAAGSDLPDPVTGAMSGEVIAATDCLAVDDAIAATQMLDEPACGNGTLLDTAAPPDVCRDGEPSALFEATFEDGLGGWTRTNEGVFGSFESRDWELVGELPQGREGVAAFATGDLYIGHCTLDDESGALRFDSPSFTMPNEDGPVVLRFEHHVATQPLADGGNLKLSRNGGPFELVPAAAFRFNPYNGALDFTSNPLSGEPAFTGSDPGVPTGTWVSSVVELDALADPGDSLVLRFDFGVDGCNGLFGWYVDDVQVFTCADAVDPSTTGPEETGDASTTTGPPSRGTGAEESSTSDGPEPGETTDEPDPSTTSPGGESGSRSSGADADANAVGRGCACAQAPSDERGWGWMAVTLLGLGWLRRERHPSA